MRLLVIDTALGACTAAVFDDNRALAVRFEPMTKGHQERLGGLVRDVMAEAGVPFDSLDRIGVTVGPGSFTGLRVGLAFAQGLGAALDRPVVGVSTLAALSADLDDAAPAVAALIDARRGQLYVRIRQGDTVVVTDQALSIAATAQRIAELSPEVALVGNGAAVLIDACPDLAFARRDDRIAPTPQALARLSAAAAPAAAPPRPLYLRAPDATPPSRLPGQPRQPAP